MNWKVSEESEEFEDTSENLQGFENKTSLILAAENGHEELASLLVNAGADVNNSDAVQSVSLFREDGDCAVYSGDEDHL